MSKFGKELRVTTVELPDVRAIRQKLHMSQQRFAAAYRIPLPTLKNWEQGRRSPDAPAAAYLQAIARQQSNQRSSAAWIDRGPRLRPHEARQGSLPYGHDALRYGRLRLEAVRN